MIKYALICECDAEFEGWFPDSASFDKQKKQAKFNARCVIAQMLLKLLWHQI